MDPSALPAYRSTLLSLDPGTDTGWSIWDIGEAVLLACGVTHPNTPIGRWEPDQVVIEMPKIRLRSKASPQAMLQLAVKVGRYVERYGGNADRRGCPVDTFFPEEWKGTLDGDVMTERIRSNLKPRERVLVANAKAGSKEHDMLDSIGLAKWWLEQRRLDAVLRAGPPKKAAA